MFPWDKPAVKSQYSGNPYTQQGFAHRMQQERALRKERANIQQYADSANSSKITKERERRVKNIVSRNHAFKCAGEKAMENSVNSYELKQKRHRTRQQDVLLAKELARRKRNQDKQMREVQQICEKDPELRQLQIRLKSAYMNKERAAQLVEKEREKEREKLREAEFAKQQEEMMAEAEAREKAQRAKADAFGGSQAEYIQEQLKVKQEKERKEAFAEYLKDKEQVDLLIADVARERAERAAFTQAKRMELQADMRRCIEDRARQLRERKAEADRLNVQAAEYQQSKDLMKEKGAQLAAQREKVRMQIYRKLEAEAKAKHEEDERIRIAIALLRKEEADNSREKAQRDKEEREAKSRNEMMAANDAQLQLKKEQAILDAQFEADLVRKIQDKYAEDEAADKAKEDRRLKARMDYGESIDKQIQHRREKYKKAMELEEQMRLGQVKKEEYRKRVVEEARKQLLKQHASRLQGFLPRGVISKPGDLEMLRLFDADGDGKLSDAELRLATRQLDTFEHINEGGQVTEAEKKARFAKFREEAKRYDVDGDGKFSQDEVDAWQEAHK